MDEKKKYWEDNLWKDLQEKDPKQICRNSSVEYDEENRCFTFPSLGRTVRIYPGEKKIESEDMQLAESSDYQLLVISYLLYTQNIEPSGEWVSEKDLKGGSLFFRGPHALPSIPLEKKFGENKELFKEKSLLLKGEEAQYGDAAMRFPVLPKIELIVVLWLKDEEFPARVTFLMDRTVESHLPLDVISAMVSSLTERLLNI